MDCAAVDSGPWLWLLAKYTTTMHNFTGKKWTKSFKYETHQHLPCAAQQVLEDGHHYLQAIHANAHLK